MEPAGVAPDGSAGKFQRLPDVEGIGEAGRFRRMSSSDGYEYAYSSCDRLPSMPECEGLSTAAFGPAKRKGMSISQTTTAAPEVHMGDIQEPEAPFLESPPAMEGKHSGVTTGPADKECPMESTRATDEGQPCQATSRGISFSEDTKLGPRLGKTPSIERKGTPGLALISEPPGMAEDISIPEHGRSGVSFAEDTKPGPRLGKVPSIQRKGTPGVALMSDLADLAEDAMQSRAPEVSFTEDTKPGPSLGRTPSIQRKGTPGVSLMSDLADMAEDINTPEPGRSGVSFAEDTKPGPRLGKVPSIQRKGTPGVALMSDLADMAEDMATSEPGRSGVNFSSDTKPGPRLGKALSTQRKGNPGVALMSDLADMATSYDEEQDRLSALFRKDTSSPCSVSFSGDTKPGPRLGKAPSIQRKGTPGVALMSDLADMAEDAMESRAPGVSFTKHTKSGPRLGKAPSIQRKGTPGVALMSDLADMADDLATSEPGRSGVSFAKETKPGPRLGKAPSIQRKGTPGVALMSDLADLAENATESRTPGVSFTEDTKPGPRLGKAPSIQRKGTPGVALLSDLADMAEDMAIPEHARSGVGFTEGTKPVPSFGQVPAIQCKATPASGLMSQSADVAEGICLASSHTETISNQVAGPSQPEPVARSQSLQAGKQLRFARGSTGSTFTPSELPRDIMASVVPRSIRFSCDGVLERQPSVASASVLGADLSSVAAEVSAICSKSQSPSLHAPKPRRGSVCFDEDINMVSPAVSRSSSLQRRTATPGAGVLPTISDMVTDSPDLSMQQSNSEDTNMDGLTLAMAELGHSLDMPVISP